MSPIMLISIATIVLALVLLATIVALVRELESKNSANHR